MKKYLFILTTLLFISCSTHKNTNAQHVFNTNRIIITDNNDTLTIKQDSIRFEFYTNNYHKEYDRFLKNANGSLIIRAIEYKIVLSPESLKMIEEDGGMTAVLKNILSKENFDCFKSRIPFTLYVILSLEDLSISEYKISIYTEGTVTGFSLSDNEITKLFAYCKKMRFIYTGTEFKDEIVPAGWMFYTKK